MTPGARPASIPAALDFVARHPHVFLLARRADGFPTGYAMTARVRDGAVEFSTYRASAKVRNLLRDGVAGIVAVSEPPDDGMVLSAEGTVTVLDHAGWLDDSPATGDAGIAPPTATPTVPPEIIDQVAASHAGGKRCVVRLTLERPRLAPQVG